MIELSSCLRRSGSADGKTGVKLFLGGLSWETSESNIRNHFERFGEIQEVVNTFLLSSYFSDSPQGKLEENRE